MAPLFFWALDRHLLCVVGFRAFFCIPYKATPPFTASPRLRAGEHGRAQLLAPAAADLLRAIHRSAMGFPGTALAGHKVPRARGPPAWRTELPVGITGKNQNINSR